MEAPNQYNKYNPFKPQKYGEKTIETNREYQSTFLPIFQHAETKIKKLILTAFLLYTAKYVLIAQLKAVIKDVDSKIPQDLYDRQAYINGLKKKCDLWVLNYYDKPINNYTSLKKAVKNNAKADFKIEKPKDLINVVSKDKDKLDLRMWEQAKASVRVENYPKEIKKYIDKLTKETLTTSEKGKHPISLWQKAELDIRHNKQMENLQKMKDDGIEYAYLSSHPDCSKRCERWQGKLVSLNEHATMSGFRVRKLDGIWVYSLNDIMSQKDKYGYENNIISGFNCRHYLIPYEKGIKPPKEFSKQDIARERMINDNIKAMEREIRDILTSANNDEIAGKILKDEKGKELLKLAKEKHAIAKKKIERYNNYCYDNGFETAKYRYNV